MKKWGAYILLGIGVAFILWLITKDQIAAFGGTSNSNNGKTPYLVPAPLPADSTVSGIPTSAGTSQSISEQNNIIGSHVNSTLWNGTIPNFVNYAPQQNGEAPIPAGSQTFGSSY